VGTSLLPLALKSFELREGTYRLRGDSAALGQFDCGGKEADQAQDGKRLRYDAKGCGAEMVLLARKLFKQGAGELILVRSVRTPAAILQLAYNCGP
jgi:hypothetical protein